ncbi:MAG TPA: hypothetical protein VG889_06275 [Rhizomicrobium sp.]|nr:hypothetical protein [Rhizomicrobium sp.]
MRATLFSLACGFALAVSAAALADEPAPKPENVTVTGTPAQKPEDPEKKVTCRHLTHEGIVTPIVQCGDKKGWDRTRQETQHSVWEMQTRSYSH